MRNGSEKLSGNILVSAHAVVTVSVLSLVLILFPASWPVQAGESEETRVRDAAMILDEIMAIPEGEIPPQLLQGAHGIGIFPGLFKAGFVIGGRYGQGIVVVRMDDGSWSNPAFVTLMGGSVGWQIGAQSTDVILVFKTGRSIDAITGGKFTLGADVSIAAGSLGRHAEASTDLELKAEILSYSRSRGLFAGLALEGAALQIDYDANAAFYNVPGILPIRIFHDNTLQSPSVTQELKEILSKYASS